MIIFIAVLQRLGNFLITGFLVVRIFGGYGIYGTALGALQAFFALIVQAPGMDIFRSPAVGFKPQIYHKTAKAMGTAFFRD